MLIVLPAGCEKWSTILRLSALIAKRWLLHNLLIMSVIITPLHIAPECRQTIILAVGSVLSAARYPCQPQWPVMLWWDFDWCHTLHYIFSASQHVVGTTLKVIEYPFDSICTNSYSLFMCFTISSRGVLADEYIHGSLYATKFKINTIYHMNASVLSRHLSVLYAL